MLRKRLDFKHIFEPGLRPYTSDQLETIIKSRLGKNLSKLFQEEALAFITKKVAGLSGDARRALAIVRQAVEQRMIEYDQTQKPSAIYIRLKDAIQELFINLQIALTASCSFLFAASENLDQNDHDSLITTVYGHYVNRVK